MTKNTPLVSIVIVNWNGLEDTKSCLKHAQSQTYKNTEIIIVDNGSTDGSIEWLTSHKGFTLVTLPKNTGFTGGHIAGLKASTGEYIVPLNNDAIMAPNYIETGIEYFQSHDKVGALGGKAYFWNDTNPLLDTTNDFYAYQNINPVTAEGIFTQSNETSPREVNNVSGSCVIIPRTVIEKYGYLHNPFFAYYEESDLFARLKRAGYKIIYHPDLAIWHANGKTAEKKGSGFSYYMMMRNRFRFAVRNFDSWSLLRFLKFYVKMGLVSSLKSIIPGKRNVMDVSYAKAFWYNVFRGSVAFKERRSLLKKSNLPLLYNHSIIREQTSVSIVVACDTKADIDACKQVSDTLRTGDEIIAVVSKPNVISYAKRFADIDTAPFRLCVDRGFFATHAENLGITCARNNWVLLSPQRGVPDRTTIEELASLIPNAQRQQKALIAFAPSSQKSLAVANALTMPLSPVIVKKDYLTDIGGLFHKLSLTDSLRALMGYAITDELLLVGRGESATEAAPAYTTDPSCDITTILAEFRSASKEAKSSRAATGPFKRFIHRNYRLLQLYYFTIWVTSFKIPVRLKLARLRNLLRSSVQLDVKAGALELKHMRNEVTHIQYGVIDLDARKKIEADRLDYLSKHPSETIVLIITRDRLSTLKQLVTWLEVQGMRKIVFIDNDSALPPLTDYLKSTNYQVLETMQNVGHTVPWTAGIVKTLIPDDFYIVSDPDVIPTLSTKDVIPHLYDIHKKYPNHLKVGLGLKIDDLPDGYDLKKEVVQWESQFWNIELEANIYEAGVDTTFALYKPYTYYYIIHPSIRTGEPYTARHLPWYNVSSSLTDEDLFYRLRADQNVNTWDKGKLPERYVKELSRQRH